MQSIAFYRRIEGSIRHHWLTIAFLCGFIVDNITLNRVDQLFDNLVLFSYVILAMLSIFLLYAGIAEKFGERISRFCREKSPILMQYAFGGLLSGILIFYGRSSSLMDSWPFILIILCVIYGNETIKERAQRLVYNLTIFYVGLFAYLVLIVPVLIGKMGSTVFVASGVLSIVVMYFFIRMLERVVPNFISLQKRVLVFFIGSIYIGFNVLYFTNLIPPIPLSLKHVGMYHSAEKTESGSYVLTYEKAPWWMILSEINPVFHYERGESIVCFTSVFAPARLSTSIYHRWQYYDEEKGEWTDHGRFAYTIIGGRGEGYRGYTAIDSYREGKWRCVIETERRQVIGKETFRIVRGVSGPLMTKIE
jgi:hypothetical protein